MPIDQDELIETLCRATNFQLQNADEEVYFSGQFPGSRYEYDPVRFSNALTNYSTRNFDGFTSWNTKVFEVAVRSKNSALISSRIRQAFSYEDHEHGLIYSYGAASDEYVVGILHQLRQRAIDENVFAKMIRPTNAESVDVIDCIKNYGFRFFTLTISSTKNRQKEDFQALLQAVLFQVSYNSNLMLIPMATKATSTRNLRFAIQRRQPLDTIDPPRRLYTPDLLHHYNMAVDSDSPFASFVSYYHVLEHYFEIVFNDDVVEMVRKKITMPAFSYKRRKDVDSLVKEIKNAFKIKADNVTFNEQEALRLTLIKFCDIQELKSRLKEFSEETYNYYRQNEVAFSKGSAIPFDATDEDVYKSLAKRIYQTRCSLVHSKDGEKNKYTPFADDDQLQKEIPLLRTLAEQVIIANSKELDK